MVNMGNGSRWALVVETGDGVSVQLPLDLGSYRVGKEVGDDIALGSLKGTLEVTPTGVRYGEQQLGETVQSIGGLKVRVTGDVGGRRQTLSLPTAERDAITPIRLTDVKGAMPPRSIVDGEMRIGADESCDLRPRSAFISQFHALLFAKGDRWFVRDLGSKNGTFLNEIRVTEGAIDTPSILRVGDVSWRVEAIEEEKGFGGFRTSFIGDSAGVREVRAKIAKFSPSKGSVLIVGESGTGKELIARALHDGSARHNKPFITLNCGAIPPSLMESELFGHAKGSFTGATDKRNGAFAEAEGGTLFLDEIGELPLDLQPKLLRALESGQIKAVGDDKPRAINVRVIAATHRDLRGAIKRGGFREDLYHRIAVLLLDVPPLRQRDGDIDVLVDHFLKEMSPEHELMRLAPDAHKALLLYSWPGNVRELKNTLMRASLLRHGPVITEPDLGLPKDESPTDVSEALTLPTAVEGISIETAERAVIIRGLKQAKGSRVRAARLLGIARSTLYRKIDEYRIQDSEYRS